MKVWRIAALVGALVVCEKQAWAREETEAAVKAEAKARFVAGQSHYNLNEFNEALVEFKEAYRLLPDPVFLYNSGQCERQLGHWDEAVRFYRSFLREQPKAPNRQDVLHKIEEIESFQKSRASDPEKTAVPATDEPAAEAVPSSEPTRPATESTPTIGAPPLPQTTPEPLPTTSVAPPDWASSHADLTTAPAAPSVQEAPRWYNHWWVWTGAAVIVAGTGVAIYAATSGQGGGAPTSPLGTKAVF